MNKSKRKRSSSASSSSAGPLTSAPEIGGIKLQGRYWLAGLALTALTLLAFSNSFSAGLALDNQLLITGDPRIQDATAHNVSQIFQHTFWWPNGEAGIYRPLTTLSFLFNYAILGNGAAPAGYHWINFLLHAANVLLVFGLCLRLFNRMPGRAFPLALSTAALWAVHPVLTESVTNIVGRADLLAGMAVLGGFWMYLKSTESAGSRRLVWLAGLAAATTAGVFSKESAVVLPGVIVLYELAFHLPEVRERLRSTLLGCAATILPIAAMLLQRALVLSASPPAEFPFVDNPIVGASFWVGRLTAIKVLARYLWLAIWPVKLAADYSYSEIPLARGSLVDWTAWIAIAIALCLVALLWRRSRPTFFFACFGFLNLLPASNLLFPIGTIMAERLLYLPLAGWLACLALAIDSAARRSRYSHLAPVIVGLIAVAFAARTWFRNIDWKDDLTMATASVQTSPGSFKVHRLLAASLYQADPGNLDRVIAEANQSLAVLESLPDELDVPIPWNQAAAYYLAKGDSTRGASTEPYQQAVRVALRSIAIEQASRAARDRAHGTKAGEPPIAAESYRTLASAYLRLGNAGEALSAANHARTIDPTNVDVYGEIADAYLAQSRGEDAAIALAQGMFATSNGMLRDDLLKLYQSGVDAKGCAVISGPRGPALNPACDIVRRDLCAAAAQAHRSDLAGQLHCGSN
jgi:tetratricopeptide (TPR) repeat protein